MIRVVLADDHELARAGMKALLKKTPGIVVVGEAANGFELIGLVGEVDPDVAVIDTRMPGMNGIVATSRLKSASSRPKIIAVSEQDEERVVLRALAAGADAFLLKISSQADLVVALRVVTKGHMYLCPEVSRAVIQKALGNDSAFEEILTLRQREVLQLLAEGHTASEIGDMIGLSRETVNAHRRNIKQTLNIADMAGLARYAVRNGLVEP